MRKINKKGFTLIELLAVIVILSVVMVVAIPSMQKVINNSKKDTLVSTALEYISGAKTMLTSENDLPGYGIATVIPTKSISLDRGGKSPFTSTDFTTATSYVIVVNKTDAGTNNAENDYEYYITLGDSSKNCLKLVSETELNNKAKETRGYIVAGSSCPAAGLAVDDDDNVTGISSISGFDQTLELYKESGSNE